MDHSKVIEAIKDLPPWRFVLLWGYSDPALAGFFIGDRDGFRQTIGASA